MARLNRFALAALAVALGAGARSEGTGPASAPPSDPVEQAKSLDAPPRARPRIWLGVFIEDAVDGGIQVIDVVPGGPAAKAGLARGDVVIRANASEVANLQDLRRATEALSPGEVLEVTLLRNGTPRQVQVVSASPPPPGWVVPKSLAPRAPPPPSPDIPADLPDAQPSATETLGLGVEEIPAPLREHLGGRGDAGLLVTRVESGGPCDGRLRPGDLLVRASAVPLETVGGLDRVVLGRRSGTIRLDGIREGAPFSAEVAAPLPTAADGGRSVRIRALERSIHDLEASLEAMKRELAKLKSGP